VTRDEVIRAMAEVVAGLQVPVSIAMPLGIAREPWGRLHNLIGGGWYDADKAEVALRVALAPNNVQGAVDITPDPVSWPECPTCGVPYVLRHAMRLGVGHTWVWQRDCKHKVEPILNSQAVDLSSVGDDVNNPPSTEVLT
jgi:hypothetical protein